MALYDNIKYYIKRHTFRSDQFLKTNLLKNQHQQNPLSIQYRVQLHAQNITSDQRVIDSIVTKIIHKDYSKRIFAGKKEADIKRCQGKIYQYESFRTQNVTLLPSSNNNLDVYVEDIFLGHLPSEYSEDVLYYLQSAVSMSFAYIKNGPYKQYDRTYNRIIYKEEPFDIAIYIQFS